MYSTTPTFMRRLLTAATILALISSPAVSPHVSAQENADGAEVSESGEQGERGERRSGRRGGQPGGGGGGSSGGRTDRTHTDREILPFTTIALAKDLNPSSMVGPIVLANERPSQILNLIERFSGRVMIADANLPKVQLNFNSGGRMRRDEAVFALENLLALNGIFLTSIDERFVKAVPAASISTRSPTIIDAIPEAPGVGSEQYFGKVFNFDYLSSNEALQQVRPLLSRGNRSSIVNLSRSNALMVVDTLTNLRRIQDLIDRIDSAPTTRFEVLFFPVENVSAWAIRNQLLQLQRSSHSDLMAHNTINVDARTNQIVVSTVPANEAFYRDIISRLDASITPATTSKVFYLDNAQASNVFRILSQIISNQRRIFDRLGFRSVDMTRTDTVLRPSGRLGEPEEGEDGTLRPGQPEMEEVEVQTVESMMQDGMPELQFSQLINVIPDNQANSIVVYGTPLDIERVGALIESLDVDTVPITASKILYLSHAPVAQVANSITRIIRHQQRQFSRSGAPRRDGRDGEEQPELPAELESDLEFSPFATLVADNRSNSLLVYGTTSDIARIESLVVSLDVDVAPRTVSETFFLQHADANQMARVIGQIIWNQRSAFQRQGFLTEATRGAETDNDLNLNGDDEMRFSPYATIVADARSNAIIVYGTPSDLRRIRSIIGETDIPIAPVTTSRVFILSNAQAGTLIGTLQSIVSGQQRALSRVISSAQAVRSTPAREAGFDVTPTDISLGLLFSPYITLTADRRSNAIIAYGTPGDIDQISTLIEATDIMVAPLTTSEVFTIKHGNARDISRTLLGIITSQQRIRQREATDRRVFLRASGRDSNEEEFSVATGALGPGQQMIESETLDSFVDFPEGEWPDDLQFSQYVSVVPDDRSNSIVAYGTEKDLAQIEEMIKKVDIVLTQVRIEVVIAEVALIGDQVSGLETFGIDYRKSPTGLINPGDINLKTGAPGFIGTDGSAFALDVGLNPFSLGAVFNIAQQNRNVKVLSAPTIVTTHNQVATVNVGQAQPIITGTTSTAASADLTTRSTVEYRDIGITLRVRPLVGDGETIQMEIEQIVETVIGTTEIDKNVQPIIGTRRANSFVSSQNEQVIILAGLQETQSSRDDGSVWLLGDIPLIGGLFRPSRDTSTVRELIIFIRPSVVRSSLAADELTEAALRSPLIGPEVTEFIETGQFLEQRQIIEAEQERQRKAEEEQEKRQEFQSAPQRRGPR